MSGGRRDDDVNVFISNMWDSGVVYAVVVDVVVKLAKILVYQVVYYDELSKYYIQLCV